MGIFDIFLDRKERARHKEALKKDKIKEKKRKEYIEDRKKIDGEISKKADEILENEFDDIALAKEFKATFTNECEKRGLNPDSLFTKYQVKGVYKLRTRIPEDKVFEIAQDFYDNIYPAVGSDVRNILDGYGRNSYNQHIKLNIDKSAKILPSATIPLYEYDDIVLNLPLYGDLRDVYSLVHEIGHTFDCQSGDNETRKIFAEVAPQTLERMLDEYLIEHLIESDESTLTDKEKQNLMLDIGDRRLSTFYKRYEKIKDVPNTRGKNKNASSRYMFAQIYQTHMMHKKRDAQKMGLVDFWDAILDNDYDLAMEYIGLDLRVNNQEKRTNAVRECIDEFFEMRDKQLSIEKEMENSTITSVNSDVIRTNDSHESDLETKGEIEDGEK